MKIASAGDRAVLVELGDCSADALHATAGRVRAVEGVIACIAGHSSLYVVFEHEGALEAAATPFARAAELTDTPSARGRVVALPVHFGGEAGVDFHELVDRVGQEEFLSRVATLRLVVRYIGFRGGFAYLDGWPEEWALPRRPTSRLCVLRGTFAIAGTAAGFYPIDSPGGWNLLGRTDTDLEHAFRPGDEIRIVPVAEPLPEPPQRIERLELPFGEFVGISSAPLARRIAAGDWSRIDQGIPPGGPFDEEAAALANLAAGREAGAELLECAIAGPRLRASRPCVIAWCGPDLRVRTWRAESGSEISIGRIEGGLRGYLAIGEREGPVATIRREDRRTISVCAGPHDAGLREVACEVTPQLDRVGIRLRPLQPLEVAIPADLRSVGMQCGTIQLHPDGSLVAMGPDHPVTGGYLQPLTVLSSQRWKLAQLQPGERVTLRVTEKGAP